MNLSVNKLDADQWQAYSSYAHLICFHEKDRYQIERIDFALLVINKEIESPVGYITCKEFDAHTIYWQHGGAFPGTIGIPVYKSYQACIVWAKNKYKRIFTLIENTNKRMLKMAMKVGFDIIGVKNIGGSIMLEHLIEF